MPDLPRGITPIWKVREDLAGRFWGMADAMPFGLVRVIVWGGLGALAVGGG